MKFFIKFSVLLILGLLAGGLVFNFTGWEGIKEAVILTFSLRGFAVVAVSGIIFVSAVWKWKFILKKMTGKRKFKGISRISISGFSITYLLTPIAIVGGEPLRAWLAKKEYGIGWEKSVASVIVERLFDWTIYVITTIGGLALFFFRYQLFSRKISFISLIFFFFLLFLLFLFYFKNLRQKSFLKFFVKKFLGKQKENEHIIVKIEKEITMFMSPAKKIFWQGMGMALVKYILIFGRISLLVFFLTKSSSLFDSFIVYAVTNLAMIAPTPATLGSMEIAGVLSFSALSFNVSSGAVLAIALRNAEIFLSLFGLFFLIKFLSSATEKKILGFMQKINNKKNGNNKS